MSSPTPSKPFTLAIIGGGISGLTLALTLTQHSIPLTIYEGAHNFSEIGAGVGFGPNSQRAMSLLHPSIRAAFDKCHTSNKKESKKAAWFTVRVGDERKADAEGYVREGKKVGDELFEVRFASERDASGGVYRAHFLDELVKSIPAGVAQFGKKLVKITDAEDGSGDKLCHFADGTTAQHTAVIGCDGIKSNTRKYVLGEEDPASRAVFSGKYAYRGLIPMDRAVELLGKDEAENSQLYMGYGGHVLTFPIERGRTMNVVAFNSRKTWEDPNWVVRTSKQDMQANYAGWGPTVQSIISAMQKPDIWALFYHLPAKSYYKGRVALLGDAAHATTPHQGAGAGMCLEDALILSSLFKEVNTVEDIERAFKAYDVVRRPRSLKNVVCSKEAGMLYDFEGEGLGDDLDAIERNFKGRMGWVWGYNPQVEIEEALKIFRGSDSSTPL